MSHIQDRMKLACGIAAALLWLWELLRLAPNFLDAFVRLAEPGRTDHAYLAVAIWTLVAFCGFRVAIMLGQAIGGVTYRLMQRTIWL